MLWLAVLREHADAPEGALLAGNVQGGVSSEVPDFQVASGLQKMLSNFRLISYHCQVKRSLQAQEQKQTVSYTTNLAAASRQTELLFTS